jgi:hypothetical protein
MVACQNPMSKTESAAAHIGVIPLEREYFSLLIAILLSLMMMCVDDIRLEDGTLPYVTTKPDNVLPIARSAPGPG